MAVFPRITPVFLPGKFHGRRSLVEYSSRGCKESDVAEQLNTHTHYIYIYILLYIIVSICLYISQK